MIKNALYFGKQEFYNLLRNAGGTWNDSKDRPLVCLLRLSENDKIYWAIPVGNFAHRDDKAKERINKYLSYNKKDIRSCFYHIGKTDVTSIFFISDVVPITDEYIERNYIGKYTHHHYIIKNGSLISELERKLKRILSWENANPNYFRQHITDIKKCLIENIEKNKTVVEKTTTPDNEEDKVKSTKNDAVINSEIESTNMIAKEINHADSNT